MTFKNATKKLEKAGYKLTDKANQLYIFTKFMVGRVKSICISRNGGMDSVATISIGRNYFPSLKSAIQY